MLPDHIQNNLTTKESAELERLEAVIADNLVAFYEVGKALYAIRDHRLYRESHKTFEDYCKDKWGMSRNYANRLVAASEVMENLVPIGTKTELPITESQARPLTALPPDQQQEVWKEAIETAPKGKVTARHVAEIVEKRTSPAPKQQQSHKYQIQQVSDAMSFATIAISQLERIRYDDPMREAALIEVENWIKNNRREEI